MHSAVPRLRVLIVDDEPDMADTLAALVRHWGHDVCALYCAQAALDKVKNFHPDVMVIDISMPDIDGNQMAQAVRGRAGPQSLLVAVTGHSEDEIRAKSARAGFDHYLVKPYYLSELENILAKAGRVPAS
jgi:DNA-binding response OmpR family regulator